MGENRDVQSDIEALQDELIAALQTNADRKSYLSDLKHRLYEFDCEILEKKKRLAEL
jgi:enoyl reductase-like protein